MKNCFANLYLLFICITKEYLSKTLNTKQEGLKIQIIEEKRYQEIRAFLTAFLVYSIYQAASNTTAITRYLFVVSLVIEAIAI